MGDFSFLINSVQNITGPMVVMWLIGGLLIWLAIKKDYEPALLLPMGFGAILVNLPDTGVLGDNGFTTWGSAPLRRSRCCCLWESAL